MASIWERVKDVFTNDLSRQNDIRLRQLSDIAAALNRNGREIKENWLREVELQPGAKDALEVYYEGQIKAHNAVVHELYRVIGDRQLQPAVLPEIIHNNEIYTAVYRAIEHAKQEQLAKEMTPTHEQIAAESRAEIYRLLDKEYDARYGTAGPASDKTQAIREQVAGLDWQFPNDSELDKLRALEFHLSRGSEASDRIVLRQDSAEVTHEKRQDNGMEMSL